MPRRLGIWSFVCVLCATLVPSPGRAEAAPRLPGRVESPVEFVLPPRPERPTLAEQAVRLARAQLGVPYVYGGASPGGFDCSGLVMWVYGRLGIPLPHNAAALYAAGRPVPAGRAHPGDLVFFAGLGHVGIYIGHDRMIHAPQTGERVEIQALGERSGEVVGVRRVAPA